MNTKQVLNRDWKEAIGSACRNCCQKVLAQMKQVREAIKAEARDTLKGQEQLLRLALNEAEALAFQTLYPQLVFPTLAVEKIQGAERWSSRQRQLA
ncbi:MAG TPA: hypothetical protein VNU95_11125 [Candidatus Acidoferrales bacterium]|jgi:hypothetical protein|nr:hypothetical protein [Candidatus Acidoferrales bacterium]